MNKSDHGLHTMIANDEARMSNDEGMTKIRMPNLRKIFEMIIRILRKSVVQKNQSGSGSPPMISASSVRVKSCLSA